VAGLIPSQAVIFQLQIAKKINKVPSVRVMMIGSDPADIMSMEVILKSYALIESSLKCVVYKRSSVQRGVNRPKKVEVLSALV